VGGTAIAPHSVVNWLADLNEQQREVQELRFNPADFMSKVKVTDEMVKDFYDKNPAYFQVPEQAKAEYVVLSMDAVAAQVKVSDADIKSYYEQNKQRFKTDEQRRASHILIAVPKSASAADKAAARDKATKLLEQVRKNPADFAKLAKANSQDPGSAEKGGDLGYFAHGSMVKPFEDAAFKLKKGEISDLVESEFGYHIITVTDIKPGGEKSLDEVKGEIASEIKKQLAAKKFTEMADTFSNTVYEQADSLKPVADKLGLKIETVNDLNRNGNPAAPQALYNNPKFLGVLFSDDSIRNKRNTEAVEVAPSTLIAGRIVEYKPASKKSLEQVKAQVTELVTKQEANQLARKAGEEKLAALKANPSDAGFGKALLVSRAKNPGLRGEAVTAILKADVSKLPAFVGAYMGSEGYGIYRINKVSQPATPDANRRKAEEQQFTSSMAGADSAAFVDAVKARAKVKINKPAVAAAEEPAK
jgi:peptidyl-prolyl cis-trans isomerase D